LFFSFTEANIASISLVVKFGAGGGPFRFFFSSSSLAFACKSNAVLTMYMSNVSAESTTSEGKQ
tara:strand:- start:5734 stop:5925 length:192 start_codon:yes stop_codon:yes gene_type:complete